MVLFRKLLKAWRECIVISLIKIIPKAQYEAKDIVCINGFNIYDFVEIKKSELLKIKKELQDVIATHDFTEYCDFIEFIKTTDNDNYFDVASSNTIFFNTYISSRRNKKHQV